MFVAPEGPCAAWPAVLPATPAGFSTLRRHSQLSSRDTGSGMLSGSGSGSAWPSGRAFS